jgi:hypothetical protein
MGNRVINIHLHGFEHPARAYYRVQKISMIWTNLW